MSQTQLFETCSKRGKNHAYMVRLVLVLLLIGRKTGASLLSQSLSVAIPITQLLSTVIWKLLYEKVNRVKMGMCLYISACPYGKPFLLCESECQFAKCPADPSASCFSDPCNKCKVEFRDAQGKQVNCTQGEYLEVVSYDFEVPRRKKPPRLKRKKVAKCNC